MEEIVYGSVVETAKAIRERKVASSDVVAAYVQRIKEVNPALNAVVHVTAEAALARAREADEALARDGATGPLHGVPMTVKDSFETAGVVSTSGTKGLASYVPRQDATVVARLRKAGAILLGKTNTPEITLTATTDNFVYGRTNNPYDVGRTPGGSSGGPAAAVAAGCAPFDVGSDLGGSIRIPAHCCGVAGLKPTLGRVSRAGHIPFLELGAAESLMQIGPIARSVRDLKLLLPIMAGADARDPAVVPMPCRTTDAVAPDTLRVAYYVDNGIQSPTTETAGSVRAACRALRTLGAEVVEDRPPQMNASANLWRQVMIPDGGSAVKRFLKSVGTETHHPLLNWTQRAEELGSSAYVEALVRWNRFRAENAAFLRSYDALLAPVASMAAHPHDDPSSFTYTQAYNLLGWPVAVVRCGTSSGGLPIGVQVVARPWQENVALAVAESLESAFGGWQPPI